MNGLKSVSTSPLSTNQVRKSGGTDLLLVDENLPGVPIESITEFLLRDRRAALLVQTVTCGVSSVTKLKACFGAPCEAPLGEAVKRNALQVEGDTISLAPEAEAFIAEYGHGTKVTRGKNG